MLLVANDNPEIKICVLQDIILYFLQELCCLEDAMCNLFEFLEKDKILRTWDL